MYAASSICGVGSVRLVGPRPQSSTPHSQITTISHLLTGMYWSGLHVQSAVDQAKIQRRWIYLAHILSSLISSLNHIRPLHYLALSIPHPPLFLSSFPSSCFLIPVHKTHQKFSLELGNEADLWPCLDDFHTCACARILAAAAVCMRVCVSAAGGWQQHD